MKINVFGLGYVGCVSAACLANAGHRVNGIDVDPVKTSAIASGRSPIVEPGLAEALREAIESGRLRTSQNIPAADLSLICVGTPSNKNGSLSLHYVKRVAEQIGRALAGSSSYHVVVLRSTVLPGTVEGVVAPILKKHSGLQPGRDFGICINPEFMREGCSLKDYYDPPFTLIGELDEGSGDTAALLYKGLKAPLIRMPIRPAEMVKYACNAFHALKVTFANEIGNFCKANGIDSHPVMEVLCRDKRLNLSPYYLKPGFAFGGSCLPKDLRALLHCARQQDLELGLLDSILPSNRRQIDLAFQAVQGWGRRRVGVLGLSFKAGSDDLRESPMVDLVERLLGKGHEVKIFDREVSMARIFGSNRRYLEDRIPHLSSLLADSLKTVVESSEVIIVGQKRPEFKRALRAGCQGKHVLDLVRLFEDGRQLQADYQGICW